MIHCLIDMIGSAEDSARHPVWGYVRAVPHPFYGGLFDRLRDARAVVAGRAFAVRWPKDGELETALAQGILSAPYRGQVPRPCGDLVPGSQS